MIPSFELEDVALGRAEGAVHVVGIDEAGVGALAGPVVAAAVVLRRDAPWLSELRDSKQLTRAARERLYSLIIMSGAAFGGMGYTSHIDIDAWGVAIARQRAVVAAYRAVQEALGASAPLVAVVDDRRLVRARPELGGAASVFADHADERSYSVAAASILAKVTRDRYMEKMGLMFPEYGFAQHKGYGVPRHLAALCEYGPCSIHRRSFRGVIV